MHNSRTLIRSSMVSLIIVLMGLFMLCMSRAPRVSIDEPLVQGGGVEFSSENATDDDLASLLSDLDEPVDARSGSSDSNNEIADDSDILALLRDDDQSSSFDNQYSDSGDEGLDEILKLLDDDDDNSTPNEIEFESSSSSQRYAKNQIGSGKNFQTGASNKAGVDDLENEVERLEDVLNNKATEARTLQAELDSYDKKINQYQSQPQLVSSGGSRTPVKKASSQQVYASEKSDYEETPKSSSSTSSRGSNFDQKYNSAMEYFYRHDYDRAVAQLQNLIETNASNPQAGACQYWIGESRFAQGKYYQAISEFTKVFAFESSDKQDDAQLMLGMAFMKLGDINSARVEFDWLVSCYSSSEYSQQAGAYLRQF